MSRLVAKQLLGACALFLVANAPVLAQRTGSSNKNAPTVTQSIAFDKNTIEISYTSITWAGGEWAKQLADEATKAEARTRINAAAEKSPLGTLKCSAPITIGGQKVAAGTYKLAFTLDDKFKWQIALSGEAGSVTCPLDLKTVEDDSKRLVTTLRAGEKDFTAELAVAFGKSRGVLPVTFGG